MTAKVMSKRVNATQWNSALSDGNRRGSAYDGDGVEGPLGCCCWLSVLTYFSTTMSWGLQ